MHLDYKHVTRVFYVRKNVAEDRYVLPKPAAGDMATKIRDIFIYHFIRIYLCVSDFTFKNISTLLLQDINSLVNSINVSVSSALLSAADICLIIIIIFVLLP